MQNALELAKAFRKKDHFSAAAWEDRGLKPSSPAVCTNLTNLLHEATDNLITAIEAQASTEALQATLNRGLQRFSAVHFDTEEKEYICELFDELGKIVGLNMSLELNSFLYGAVLAELLMKQKNRKVIETLEFACTKCATALRIHIMQERAGIPAGWTIASCNNCQELNLLEFREGIKEMKFDNYQLERSLRADEFTREEALKMLNEMKNT